MQMGVISGHRTNELGQEILPIHINTWITHSIEESPRVASVGFLSSRCFAMHECGVGLHFLVVEEGAPGKAHPDGGWHQYHKNTIVWP